LTFKHLYTVILDAELLAVIELNEAGSYNTRDPLTVNDVEVASKSVAEVNEAPLLIVNVLGSITEPKFIIFIPLVMVETFLRSNTPPGMTYRVPGVPLVVQLVTVYLP
jgi:hypothetical protein